MFVRPRHGAYARKTPRGTRIARWYCPERHTTFSLLSDCLAARLPGALDSLEAVVAHAEQAPSRSAAGDALRPEPVELPGAMRWVERRVRLVHHVLTIVIGLLPECLARCIAEMGAVRARLDTDTALAEMGAVRARARHRHRARGAAHPHRRAAARTARTVGVPPPPPQHDESQSRAPTQDGA